uniref:MABP domain-containing protein n=1 Tax=Parastrongyloides trichosuri TaxID=131310 RepID=A0A0N4ZRC2_PARTI
MLKRSTEFEEELGVKPIYGICIITDPKNAPKNYTPIVKTFDDGTDADLWKEGGFTSFFSRPVRYLCVNRIPENGQTEILHDIQIKKEDVTIPPGFTEISFTADTKEKSLRKYRLLVSFLPKEKIIDAITDIIVVKTNKPYRRYTPAGEIDGLRIWYKASSIQTCLLGFPKSASNPLMDGNLYPQLPSNHSSSISGGLNKISNDFNAFTIKAVDEKSKILQNLPLILNEVYVKSNVTNKKKFNIPEIPFLQSLNSDIYKYDLERSILERGY